MELGLDLLPEVVADDADDAHVPDAIAALALACWAVRTIGSRTAKWVQGFDMLRR